MSEKSEKLRLPITHSGFAKALAFVLALVFLAAAALGVLASAFCLGMELYYKEEAQLRREQLGSLAAPSYMAWSALVGGEEELASCLELSNVALAKVEIYGELEGGFTVGAYSGGERFQRIYGYRSYDRTYNDGSGYVTDHGDRGWDLWYTGSQIPEDGENYLVLTVWMDSPLSLRDDFFWASLALELLVDWCWYFPLLGLLGLLGCVLCLVFLCRAAGRRRSGPLPCPSWATKVPFDLASAACAGAIVLLIALMVNLWWGPDIFIFAVMVLCCLAIAGLLLWWIMSLALRIKLGILLKNTLIFMLLRFALRCLRALGRFAAGFFRRLGLVWRTALALLALALLQFIVILATQWSLAAELLLWLLQTLLLLALGVYFAYMLRELQRMAAALAVGDTGYSPDRRFMPLPLKNHAAHLDNIGQGIDRAVEERMKSERMRTELITNVSHDIKTPLTSIINYADLIGREETDNPRIKEYSQVLGRQSVRMKRLLEDLVEASKVSTGNVELELAPVDAGVMLMQVAGEYQQRLEQQGLSLVAGQPVHSMVIMADGRRLWRVMDNLMNNICKYAMPGTRVYLSLEDIGGHAVMSFKNTSREQLNVSPEELMERFVRGDAARHGEGSGLGLSIAQSLCRLQGGTLEISCDGDLFKAVLRFPIVAQ